MDFFANESSLIVHSGDCEYAALIDGMNLQVYTELIDAMAAGFNECGWCIGGGKLRELNRVHIVRARSNLRGECLVCGETRGVQAAHIIPRRDGGVATMPLCPNHHWYWDHGLLNDQDKKRLWDNFKGKFGVTLKVFINSYE